MMALQVSDLARFTVICYCRVCRRIVAADGSRTAEPFDPSSSAYAERRICLQCKLEEKRQHGTQ